MRDLNHEFDRLNEAQRQAVEAESNIAVLAGPGSGKTATLAVKLLHLQAEIVSPPAGIACLTFNNDAVREIKNRLAEFGVYPSRSLVVGTVHSFCLNYIIRRYAALVDPRYRNGFDVAGADQANQVLDIAIGRHLPDIRPEFYRLTMTRFRRAEFCGEDTSGFDDRNALIARDYELLLDQNKLIDFEGMVGLALQFIRSHAWIRSLIAARFPWLIVDEYQDLGGPLHAIVTTLIDCARVNVFAVGDPDQTIYDFTGADPKYLKELSLRADFKALRLKFNYRSGKKLILAGQAALAPEEPREYEPDPTRTDQGKVYFVEADNHLTDHAAKAVASIRTALATGTKPEEIAIFYRQRTQVLAELTSELDAASIDYFPERSSQYPSSPCVRWLHDVAAYVIGGASIGSLTFRDLYHYYRGLAESAGKLEQNTDSLVLRTLFHETVTERPAADVLLGDWIRTVDSKLNVFDMIAKCVDRSDDKEALDLLRNVVQPEAALEHTTLVEFAGDGRIRGKVLLTTLHSCKGRQFDVVIMPGLVEGIMPPWRWSRGQYHAPPPKLLGEIRRLFYVGFTRARHTVYLVYSNAYIHKGHQVRLGQSRFVNEIAERIAAT
jgi:DNA helicase-2/ATP-dependent DNA helicase PcrA